MINQAPDLQDAKDLTSDLDRGPWISWAIGTWPNT